MMLFVEVTNITEHVFYSTHQNMQPLSSIKITARHDAE